MDSVSANHAVCVCWQRGLEGAGGRYPALWYSWVIVLAECGGGLERAAGWYEGQLAQTLHFRSVGVSHGATRGVRLL